MKKNCLKFFKVGFLFLLLNSFAYAFVPNGDGLHFEHYNNGWQTNPVRGIDKSIYRYANDYSLDKRDTKKWSTGKIRWWGYIWIDDSSPQFLVDLRRAGSDPSGNPYTCTTTLNNKVLNSTPQTFTPGFQKFEFSCDYYWGWSGQPWMGLKLNGNYLKNSKRFYLDLPKPKLTISPETTTVLEGKRVRISIELDHIFKHDVTIDYTTQDATAVSPEDYKASSGTIIIPAGSMSRVVTILTKDDDKQENKYEKLYVQFSNLQNATLVSNSRSTITIRDNDGANDPNNDVYIDDSSVIDMGTQQNDGDKYASYNFKDKFDLRFGGAGYGIHGDLTAIGESVIKNKRGWNTNENIESSNTQSIRDVYEIPKNSSRAELKLPAVLESGANIAYARLYWQGMVSEKFDKNDNVYWQMKNHIRGWTHIKFQTPDGVIHDLKSPKQDSFWDAGWGVMSGGWGRKYKAIRFSYQASVDVTKYLKDYIDSDKYQKLEPNKKQNLFFSAGEIVTSSEGKDIAGASYNRATRQFEENRVGHYGGWVLAVVYDMKKQVNEKIKYKNISLYDGFTLISPWDNQPQHEVEIEIKGFLTPLKGEVDSLLTFFAGRAKGLKHKAKGYLKLQNKKHEWKSVYDNLSPINNPANGTFTLPGDKYHNNATNINPTRLSHAGTNLNTFNVSGIMENEQTDTKMKLGGTFDAFSKYGYDFSPGMMAFSTELYAPKLCYDYAYSQNGRYFTEDNDGKETPDIVGSINPNEDINVTLYIRNAEVGDFFFSDIELDIYDINTTQAMYEGNKIYVTKRNEATPRHILNDQGLEIDTDNTTQLQYINKIPVASIGNEDFAYVYYALKPQGGKTSINMPINAKLEYNIRFLDSATGIDFSAHQATNLTDGSVPMCSGDILKYDPIWGRFNVATKHVYHKRSPANPYPKFNIPTQVVHKPSEFIITSHKEEPKVSVVGGQVPYIEEEPFATVVAIDTIDASKFHFTKASCDEISSSSSKRYWVPMFDKNYEKTSQKDLKKALEKAGGSIEEFFSVAKRNMAFRVIVNTVDKKNSMMHITPNEHDDTYRIDGFTKYLEWLRANIEKPGGGFYASVNDMPCKNNTEKKVVQVCSSTFMNLNKLSKCNECLLGYKNHNTCSRDNFAVRPESFYVKLNDIDQANPATPSSPPMPFATDRTGKKKVLDKRVDMAAGYRYQVDINATSHKDEQLKATPGYTRSYRVFTNKDGVRYNKENNVTFYWNGPAKPNCNDTKNYMANEGSMPIYFIDGKATGNILLNNVGNYKLSVIDKGWTLVDWQELDHHKKATIFTGGINSEIDVTRFFVDQGRGVDCMKESHRVTSNTVFPTLYSPNATKIENLNGCDISTKEHNNQDTKIKYRDYEIEFHPYKFRHTLINTYWNPLQNYDPSMSKNWLYMVNMDHEGDINQSVHFRGDIEAVGYNDHNLTNFVDKCYAKDFNVTFARVMSGLIDVNSIHPKLQYRAFTYDENNNTILDANQITDYNTAETLVRIGKNSFTQGLAGKMQLNTNANFTRERNITVNPIRVLFQDINSTCENEKECTMQANFNNSFVAGGNSVYNRTFDFFYGRIWAPDLKDVRNSTVTTFRYEIFCSEPECDSTIYPLFGSVNPDSNNWHLNFQHVDMYGDVSNTISKNKDNGEELYSIINPNPSTIDIVAGEQKDINISASEKDTLFDDIIQIYPSFWLLYDEHNGSVDTFDFSINFIGPSSWSGQGALGNVLDDADNIQRSNRRLDW